MPLLDVELRQRADSAIGLARAGEIARSSSQIGSAAWRELNISRLEFLYEMALLRVFVEWEVFLEATFARYLCGYTSKIGTVTPTGTSYLPSIGAADSAMRGGRDYILWHDPSKIVSRSQQFFVNGPHEVVVGSNASRLASFAAVRHRIAHGQEDARKKFDAATMLLAGRRYRGSRPGRFLRDWDTARFPTRRWLDSIGDELCGLATQIA
jgi:hypothetical protein